MKKKKLYQGKDESLPLISSNPLPTLIIDNRQYYQTPFEGVSVSKDGWVYKIKTKRVKRLYPTRGVYDCYGYLFVNVPNIAKMFVHQLMMLTFYEQNYEGYDIVVDHINGIRDDNRLENLRYLSRESNSSRKVKKTKSPLSIKVTSIHNETLIHYDDLNSFLLNEGVARSIWEKWIANFNKKIFTHKSSNFELVDISLVENQHYKVIFNDIMCIAIIDGIPHKFKSIKSMMNYCGHYDGTFKQYVIDQNGRWPKRSKYELIDYKLGSTTIEIVLRTKVE